VSVTVSGKVEGTADMATPERTDLFVFISLLDHPKRNKSNIRNRRNRLSGGRQNATITCTLLYVGSAASCRHGSATPAKLP
jgi:hypothetical protein